MIFLVANLKLGVSNVCTNKKKEKMNKKKKTGMKISLSIVYFVVALMCYYFDYNIIALVWLGVGVMYLCKGVICYTNNNMSDEKK